ncbi:MAG: glycosyltransferase [Planctomycetota bacterium]|jgi:GT2 family glycosyltransferase
MEELKKEADVIAVMGTGRSGTSVITKILNILGVFLGPDRSLMKPTVSNPKGYFELQPIFKLNDEILAKLGGTWLNPPDFQEGWENAPLLEAQHAKLEALIAELFKDAPCWAWKDPRSCWVLPFWRRHIPQMKYILALRNPLDVARSLQKADDIPIAFGLTYWHRAMHAVLKNTAGQDRLLVFYDDIMEDWPAELDRIARFIGRSDEAATKEVRNQVSAFVEGRLHRNRTTTIDVLQDKEVTFTAQSLYMALRACVNSGANGFDGALDHFADSTIRIQNDLDRLILHCECLEKRSNTNESAENIPSQRAEPQPAGREKPGADLRIIIPVFNKQEMTQRCLETLFQNTPEALHLEVLVVDNGSSDGTSVYLEEACDEYSNLQVISFAENKGFALACNQGAENTGAPLLLFLNNDTEVMEGWLEPLLNVMDTDPQVAAVGSKMLYPKGTIQHAGVVLCEDRGTGDPLVAKHIYNGLPADYEEASELRVYQALTAACLLVRRSDFIEAGGFDEGFWNGYEDVDLCLRFQEMGKLCVFQPASKIIHRASQSGSERFQRARENIGRLHQKWLGKVKPDVVIQPNGTVEGTDANRIGRYLMPEPIDGSLPGEAAATPALQS